MKGRKVKPNILKVDTDGKPVFTWRKNMITESNIKNPEYYLAAGPQFEPFKYIEAHNLGYHLGSVIKYISRAGKKPGNSKVDDLLKAIRHLEEEIVVTRKREAREAREAMEE